MSFEATAPTDKQVTLKKAVESSISSLSAFPTCARVNGNRALVPLWARCASVAPLDVYIYAFGGESSSISPQIGSGPSGCQPFTRARLASL